MNKLLLFILSLLYIFENGHASNTTQDDDLIPKLEHLSLQQLIDTGDRSYYKDLYDKALICYSLVINTPEDNLDFEGQKKIVEAFNKSAIIYNQLGDYRTSFKLLIKGLEVCEKYRYDQYISRFYTNIGDIYYHLEKYDMAQAYALKALASCRNDISMITILNNLGFLELKRGKTDNVLGYLNQSLQISKQHKNVHLHVVLNSIATYYREVQQYDSAFYYFRLSSDEADRNYKNKAKLLVKAQNLSELGKLFFEVGRNDSAFFYVGLSNAIATKNNFGEVLVENYTTLSKIEESKGSDKNALRYFKKYVNLKDSIINVDRFGEINQIQRLYEITKTNQQIEQLSIEQKIKERTIYYQKRIQLITYCVLLLICAVLLLVFFQKRKLNRAYKVLFEKNEKIIQFQNDVSEKHCQKYHNRALSDEMQNELLNKIFILMEDTFVVCDAEFSLDKLAESVQSNHAYVSQVINTALKKNFRSFLNGYRIQEAQRLLSDPDAAKYTLEFIALRVGFKSSSTFRAAFKEVTGVSPNFYLKSMREQLSNNERP